MTTLDYKKYNNIKIILRVSETVVFLGALILLIFVNLNHTVYNNIVSLELGELLSFLIFVYVLDLGLTFILFPVAFYSGFILEHRFGLSDQKFLIWIKDEFKSLLVSSLISLPLLLFFYYIIHTFTAYWWLPFGIIMFFFSVILAQIFPVLIFPIFYKSVPVENEELVERIKKLSHEAGVVIENVKSFNMSRSTKKANALFTGLGRTKRILLGDTLLNKFTIDEIETVLAHELGHYKYNHIVKNLFIGTFFSFFSLFSIAKIYEYILPFFHQGNVSDTPALPILLLVGMIIGLIVSPILSGLSRKNEFQADRFAVTQTGKYDIFIEALNKLNTQNLGDRDPHPIIEWLFYSHPSINNRIKAIEKLKQESGDETVEPSYFVS